jgi:hypothetical protein
LSDSPSQVSKPIRHQNMYAHHMWMQQRFFAGFLVLIGIAMTAILVFDHKLVAGNLLWLAYVPSGLLLGGGFLLYRWRHHVKVLDTGLRISTFFSHVLIDYDSIRLVKVQVLRNHFQERRSRLIARIMKPQIDKPALFVRLRGDTTELAAIQKKLGARLMYEDTIAIPVPDADALAWEISPHLPERIGQNLGGGKRRKKRR